MKMLFYLLTVIFIVSSSIVIAQNKTSLADEIKKEIDTQGIETAKKYFADQYKSHNDLYEVDMKAISNLSRDYSKAGNLEAAGAVMTIASPFIKDIVSSNLSKMNVMTKSGEQNDKNEKNNNKREKLKSKEKVEHDFGKARNDLDHFTGIYGDPNETNKTRRLWVRKSCDGYLVIGALWGDASPWWMKSESDKVFTYSDSFSNIKIEFVMGNDNKALKMNHDLSFMKTPLERLEPIPDDWDPCIKRTEQ